MNIRRKIVETKSFAKEIAGLLAKNSLLKNDYEEFKKSIAEYPEQAPILIGTGGVRKARLKSSTKGKSGGFRVCYLYYVDAETIYLLFVFQKNEQENLNAAQKKFLKSIVHAITEKK